MGIFDDLLYPDNKNRALRATQLTQDCYNLTASLAENKERIDAALHNANALIINAYQNLAQGVVPVTPYTIDEGWVVPTVDLIAPIISWKVASDALLVTARSWLLSQGRIGEAAFIRLAGLPGWMPFGRVMGGIAAAVAVEALISSVAGAVQRDTLRGAIRDLYSPRIMLKRNEMINAQILLSLQAIIAAYQVIVTMPGMTFTKEQLDSVAQCLINKNTVNINGITEAAARTNLARFDEARSAWTNEDPEIHTPIIFGII